MQKTIYIPDNKETKKVLTTVNGLVKDYNVSFSELCYAGLKLLTASPKVAKMLKNRKALRL